MPTKNAPRYEQTQSFFRRNGAYARFKDMLNAEGALEKWYAFEQDRTKKALTAVSSTLRR